MTGKHTAAGLIARPCPTCGYQIDRVEYLTTALAETAAERDRLYVDYHRVAKCFDDMHDSRDEERERVLALRAVIAELLAALEEAISFQNEDIECLVGGQCIGETPDDNAQPECPDRRCHDHGCMVARVNNWRAAIAMAVRP